MLHDPSGEEIYEIALSAAEEKPLEGLMLLERAQNSGKFGVLDIKRLADAERGLFKRIGTTSLLSRGRISETWH